MEATPILADRENGPAGSASEMTFVEKGSLLREGDTCWRAVRADRVAFLVDGEACFAAIADALENARESIWLLGWDFHSGVRLRRGRGGGGPDELVPLLESVVRARPGLHARILGWDFAMMYALEREFLPLLQFGAKTHRRIHFAMDSAHPLAASQHQKLVVVDDRVAFAGGFDLTAYRWDTREHLPEDPRRVTPAGSPYAPFHDVQIAVDGEAAATLGSLARTRWRRATGRRVRAARGRSDPWPESLAPHAIDVAVGISRTMPSYGRAPEVREVEALYRASIASARRWIYIENQYLTSSRIAGWLAERLAAPDGPEIVIVGPRENSGWLEESTMGALRDRTVRALREADPGDRLRVLYPHRDDLPADQMLNVHSKVMVVDDAFARVGSANLSNRSMGLDTECDVSIEARGQDAVREAIAAFRNDLLAEHLGATASRVAEQLERTGSLVRTVEALCGGARTLRPLELDASDWTAEAVSALGAVDPEHPVPLEELLTRFEGEGAPAERNRGRAWMGVLAVVVVVVGAALVWRVTPLGDQVTTERLAEALAFFRSSWHGPLTAVAIFTAASLALVPVTALTVAAGLALGPALGIAVAWAGCIGGAALGYLAGRLLWRQSVRRLAGRRLNALSRRLARRGILSSAVMRLVPIAPFTVVNLVAGASHVRARDFVIGTALGMLPGTVLLIFAADRIAALFTGAGGPTWLWAALAVLALAGAFVAVRRLPWRGATARKEAS